jgi:hypothetical protein
MKYNLTDWLILGLNKIGSDVCSSFVVMENLD